MSTKMETEFHKLQQGLLDYLSNLRFHFLVETLENQYGIRQKNIPLIERVVCKSVSEWWRRHKDPDYYLAHSIVHDSEMERIFSPALMARIEALKPSEVGFTFLHHYKDMLIRFNDDREHLLSRLQRINSDIHPCQLSPRTPTRPQDFLNFAEKIVYLTDTSEKYIPPCPEMSTLLIRQALEMSIRNAFGVLAIEKKGRPEPISLSRIIEAAKVNVAEWPLSLHEIERIMKWTNQFVHGAVFEYAWVPTYLLDFVRPLIFQIDKTAGYCRGLYFSDEYIESVRKKLSTDCEGEIYGMPGSFQMR